MIKLRLRRTGAKKKPSYRIVVADARAKRDGRFIETVGHYNPLTHPSTIVLDNDRARYWLSQGAQPTDRVAKLLKIQGVTDVAGKVLAVEAPVVVAAETPVVQPLPAPAVVAVEAPATQVEPV